MKRPLLLSLAVIALALVPTPSGIVRAGEVAWSDWSKSTFDRARRENRILVIEVSAAWCHWCHVMERETYADPRVRERLSARFLPVKVDADARPDLAERYAEYHWPATVFLTPDARPVTALRGYRGPEDFLRILADVDAAVREGRAGPAVTAPSGRPAAAGEAADLPALRARLRRQLDATYDAGQGGWGLGQKYPHPAPVLHALLGARVEGDGVARERALLALAQAESLIDPVFGGMYQYSEGGVWSRPHFEKIASVNAGAMSTYASAFALTGDARWLRDANAVRRFVTTMLRAPSGAFYTSQDADVGAHGDAPFVDGHTYFDLGDAARRRLGLPRVDRAIYAQENGWFIEGLVDLHRASGDPEALRQATAAARAVLATHRDPGGGLRHAATDADGLHLGDQSAFGRACVALADATGDRTWLDAAVGLADAMRARLLDPAGGGFFSRTEDATAPGVFRERLLPYEGNAAAARFLLALHAATGTAAYRTHALAAIASVSAPELSARFGWRCASLLLAVEEASLPWARATLVASDDDPAADAMWRALRALDAPLLVRERVTPGEASSGGTTYPSAPSPAIYVCGDGRCSPPVRRAADLLAAWKAFARR